MARRVIALAPVPAQKPGPVLALLQDAMQGMIQLAIRVLNIRARVARC